MNYSILGNRRRGHLLGSILILDGDALITFIASRACEQDYILTDISSLESRVLMNTCFSYLISEGAVALIFRTLQL